MRNRYKLKKVKLYPFAVKIIERILASDYCADRGFEMTATDLIEELLVNFEEELERTGRL